MNGPLIEKGTGTVGRHVPGPGAPRPGNETEKIERLCLAALSRKPTSRELPAMHKLVRSFPRGRRTRKRPAWRGTRISSGHCSTQTSSPSSIETVIVTSRRWGRTNCISQRSFFAVWRWPVDSVCSHRPAAWCSIFLSAVPCLTAAIEISNFTGQQRIYLVTESCTLPFSRSVKLRNCRPDYRLGAVTQCSLFFYHRSA